MYIIRNVRTGEYAIPSGPSRRWYSRRIDDAQLYQTEEEARRDLLEGEEVVRLGEEIESPRPSLNEAVQLLRAVRDFLKFQANSEGGLAERISYFLRRFEDAGGQS